MSRTTTTACGIGQRANRSARGPTGPATTRAPRTGKVRVHLVLTALPRRLQWPRVQSHVRSLVTGASSELRYLKRGHGFLCELVGLVRRVPVPDAKAVAVGVAQVCKFDLAVVVDRNEDFSPKVAGPVSRSPHIIDFQIED